MNHPRFVRALSSEQNAALRHLHRTGRRHRVRQRAHAVLLSARDYSLDQKAHGKHWNVCGFLRGDGELAHAGRVGRLGSKEFNEEVDTRLLPILRRPAVLVLDNGPCHRSRFVRAKRAE